MIYKKSGKKKNSTPRNYFTGNKKTIPSKDKTKGLKKTELMAIPPLLEELISAFITEKTGKEISDSGILDKIRQSVMAQKSSYWKESPGKSVKYGKAYDIFAYIAYHLPVYFTQFRSLFLNLRNEGGLPEGVILLDVGTGPGVVPLAAMDIWKSSPSGSLDIYAIEQSAEHCEAFDFFTAGYNNSDSKITVHPVVKGDLTSLKPTGYPGLPKQATVISFQNVLAELEHLSIPKRSEIVLSYTNLLEENGFLIIVEPAELRHATSLRRLQKELMKGGLHVYAPCSYLWGSNCDPAECWTFREDAPIQATGLMKLLAGEDEGYRFINTDIKYSYLIMTKSEKVRCSYRVPRKNRMVRLSQLDRFESRVISVAGARMSADIGTGGMHIMKICDGTCREPVYAVLSGRNRRPGHSALFSAEYGEVLTLSGVQVRRHTKHDAWNLIIRPDSEIVRVEPPKRPGNGAEKQTIPPDTTAELTGTAIKQQIPSKTRKTDTR